MQSKEQRKLIARKRALAWYYANKERHALVMKKYHAKNRTRLNQEKKKYYIKNKKHFALLAVKYRKKNSKRIKLKQREWYLKNKSSVFISVKRNENPIKKKARRILWDALVSGKIKKQPCIKCGNKKVEAHHDNYSKPLEVIWFCKPHHHQEKHSKYV